MKKMRKCRCFIISICLCFFLFGIDILCRARFLFIASGTVIMADSAVVDNGIEPVMTASVVTRSSIKSVLENIIENTAENENAAENKNTTENMAVTGSSIELILGRIVTNGSIQAQIMPQRPMTESSIFSENALEQKIELPIEQPLDTSKYKKTIMEELPIGTNKLELHMIQKKKCIIVRWKEIKQASRYEVYLTGEDGIEKLWKTTKETKIVFNLQAGVHYKIKVRIVDKKRNVLASSKKYIIFLPKKVSGICTCSMKESCVRISWKSSKNAEEYIIYRKEGNHNYKKIGQSRKCYYQDKKIKQGKAYHYKIIPIIKTNAYTFAGMDAIIKFNNKKIVLANHQKYTYKEMAKDICSLKQKYCGLIDYKIIGKSEDGRDIYDVILGNQEAKKSILVVSTLHAREYMASLLCMNQMEYYLQNYYKEIDGRKNKDILKHIAIHYIPMANPDGVTISQQGIASIRNEQMREKLYYMAAAGSSTERWKANANGVDLNRNFPYQFQEFGEAGPEGFSGKASASERETRAVLELIKTLKEKHNLQSVINYHAMGSIVFGSCKGNGAVKESTKRMYQLARKVTGYISAKEYSSNTSQYGDAGNLREYLLYKEEIPSITVEIGKISCPGPISEFSSIWSRNCDLILKEAELFL